MNEKIYQEWYCTVSGGGCGGYIIVKLNIQINGIVEVVCPKCKHKHKRCIKDGVIKAEGRHLGDPIQEICPNIEAWSEKSRSSKFENKRNIDERDGKILSKKDIENMQAKQLLEQSKNEYLLGKILV